MIKNSNFALPTYADYYSALYANGRSEEEIKASIERNKVFVPMLWFEGNSINTTDLKVKDWNRLLGKPKRKKREVSDETLMRYVKMAKERGLI